MTHKVAVLLATYNGEKYLPEFFESLLCQSYKNFEIFIRDDGSSDSTLRVINNFSYDLRINLLGNSEHLGAARNFLQLLVESGDSFDCYMFADQDDYWHSEKINRAQSTISKREDPVLYFTRLEVVDSKLNHIRFSLPPKIIDLRNALVENIVTGCTSALNMSARKLIIENLPTSLQMHDWWFYIVFSALSSIVYDDFISLKYRQHDSNVVGAHTSAFHDFIRRARRFFSNNKNGIFAISNQAEELYSCFGRFLDPQNIKLVQSIAKGKKTLYSRLGLSLNSNFVRQKSIDTLILRIIFLLGRF